MFLTGIRFSETEESTLTNLLLDGEFECWLLEPPAGERIPNGIYKLELHTAGRLHEKYAKDYPGIHQGMVLISGVSGRSGIIIHIGNFTSQTDGCPLTGSTCNNNQLAPARTYDSEAAYLRFYQKILPALQTEECWLCIGTPVELIKFEPFGDKQQQDDGGEDHG